EEKELKKNKDSLIHLILPDGKGEEQYQNAKKAFENFVEDNAVYQADKPSIYVYRQESEDFSQQGFILGASLQDYEDDEIVKHEHTREKPLKDRIKHITTTNVAAGLVWNVFKANEKIKAIMEDIKKEGPLFDFEKYGYRHLLWEESNQETINKLEEAFQGNKIFIADGHHRAASANEYRKMKLKEKDQNENDNAPWKYLLTYVASDDQVRILSYNRVVRKLPMEKVDFLEELKEVYQIEKQDQPFNPEKKHEVALCCKGTWYKLNVKNADFDSKRDSLDVAILQDEVLEPILGIENPRASDNLFFVGGTKDPADMEKYVTEKGNDLFINLYPVDIRDLEEIAEKGGVMPPKSTWFDPKVLSGLVLYKLD
ncbi:MAG TPA: DUF1015 family protein, partial [Candidatus Paceibacterota bacterium]|nr:DUF1015 family protein [Candidatus Paceibacterota bacterium]